MYKNSKQHSVILEFLQQNKTHPTAAEIYNGVRKEIPNISLGTVYRNLTKMVERGEVTAIAFTGDEIHYDATTEGHLHLYCTVCGKTEDVELSDVSMCCAALDNGFTPAHTVSIVYGVCKNCQNSK